MDEITKPKRKTHTSSAVKRRYNAKTYDKFEAQLIPETSERIAAYCAAHKLSRSQFIERALDILDPRET
mgnify:CR=1 FL=1|nr:MAG TPA: Replication regulatory protein [Caudoviricetes sp.]